MLGEGDHQKTLQLRKKEENGKEVEVLPFEFENTVDGGRGDDELIKKEEEVAASINETIIKSSHKKI